MKLSALLLIASVASAQSDSVVIGSKKFTESYVLAEIARHDFGGVPLAEALRRLIKEHRVNKIMMRYAELQSDPQEWASYRGEAVLTDNAAGDGDRKGDHRPQGTTRHATESPALMVVLRFRRQRSQGWWYRPSGPHSR